MNKEDLRQAKLDDFVTITQTRVKNKIERIVKRNIGLPFYVIGEEDELQEYIIKENTYIHGIIPFINTNRVYVNKTRLQPST